MKTRVAEFSCRRSDVREFTTPRGVAAQCVLRKGRQIVGRFIDYPEQILVRVDFDTPELRAAFLSEAIACGFDSVYPSTDKTSHEFAAISEYARHLSMYQFA